MSASLTLIMPAWNAEKEIERSVRSVLAQSYRDLRLIVVNDGSSDGTEAILERLAAEDARLTPMTVPNGGPAKARNLALDALEADTRYVMFIDADDELLPDAAQKAVDAAERGAELVIFGFSIIGSDGSRRDYCERGETLTRAALGGALGRLYKANLLNQVWGKLFSAPQIREGKLRFPDYRWGEDRFFVFDCLERAKTVAVLPDCLYRYIMHGGESLISRYYDKKFAVCLEIDRRMERLCRDLGVTDERDFRYMFAKSVFSCLTVLYAGEGALRRPADGKAANRAGGVPRRRLDGQGRAAAVHEPQAQEIEKSVSEQKNPRRLRVGAGSLFREKPAGTGGRGIKNPLW